MANRLQLRRGAFNQLETTGTPYQDGEPLYVSDRGLLLIGDNTGSGTFKDPVLGGLNNIMNTWDADVEYMQNHIVKYEGTFYVAQQTTEGHTPGAMGSEIYWTQISYTPDQIQSNIRVTDPNLVHLNVNHGNFGIAYDLVNQIVRDTSQTAGTPQTTNYAFSFNAVTNVAEIAVERNTAVSELTFPRGTYISLTQGNSTADDEEITDVDSNGQIFVVTAARRAGLGNATHTQIFATPWPLARQFALQAATEITSPASTDAGLYVRQAEDTAFGGTLRIFTPDTIDAEVYYDSAASGLAGHPVLSSTRTEATTLPANPNLGQTVFLSAPALVPIMGINDDPTRFGGRRRVQIAPYPLTRLSNERAFTEDVTQMRSAFGGSTICETMVNGHSFCGWHVAGDRSVFSPLNVGNHLSRRALLASFRNDGLVHFGLDNTRPNQLQSAHLVQPRGVQEFPGRTTLETGMARTDTLLPVALFDPIVVAPNAVSARIPQFNPFNIQTLARFDGDNKIYLQRHGLSINAESPTRGQVSLVFRAVSDTSATTGPATPAAATSLASAITSVLGSQTVHWMGFYNGNNLVFSLYGGGSNSLVHSANANSLRLSTGANPIFSSGWGPTSGTGALNTRNFENIDNIRVANHDNIEPFAAQHGIGEDYNFLPIAVFNEARDGIQDLGTHNWFYDCQFAIDEGKVTYDGINWRQ